MFAKLHSFSYFVCFVILNLIICANGQHQHYLDSSRANELYEFIIASGNVQLLANGNSESVSIQLDYPINFFSEKYDQIFINTNGILTFNYEFTEYSNQPFPLEYPSIAPFYSNVDTSGANSSTFISVFVSRNAEQLYKATGLVQSAFVDRSDFQAEELIVATWKNVGYFDSKTDRLNTFQAIIISNDEETYVQFIYPVGGLNWIRGEVGSMGLPDIRAQAGFVAEDGRFYNLKGSGTDNVRFLNENSNVGVPGVWLYRVGALNYNESVQLPDNAESNSAPSETVNQCQNGWNSRCHANAHCTGELEEFCCVCNDDFYGNGYNCLKKKDPIRVIGSLSGEINGLTIDERSKLQSYVVTTDTRSYTAVSPVSTELAEQLRLALPVFSTIGWVFAKPINDASNGYQITGGTYVHTSTIRFDSGEILVVNETFEGLNYWDQLSVKIELHGEVPNVDHRSKLNLADYIDEYQFVSPEHIISQHRHTIEIPAEHRSIDFDIDQSIQFSSCLLRTDANPTGGTISQKVSKIVFDYFERDQALRSSVVTKVGVDDVSNACNDGTASCGEKTICVPYDDTYRCDCMHGYRPELDENDVEACVDIDECAIGTDVCDDNALCTNNDGGFTCICLEGYEGNGYHCLNNNTADNMESRDTTLDNYNQNTERTNSPLDIEETRSDDCQSCSPDAECVEGRCRCHDGFEGNGFDCQNRCPHDEAWEGNGCVPVPFDNHEVEPHCNFIGECSCPEDFQLVEEEQICRFVGHYELDSKSDELVPCDVDSSCHINASCEWYEHEMRHICTCYPGFHGDGYNCEQIDESCAIKPEICDPQATCVYNVHIGKSECQCKGGYEGDGFRCRLAPECRQDSDCDQSATCDNGVCQCIPGYERDVSDKCVPAGLCGTVLCGANAICKWDLELGVQYCACITGFTGDALEGCHSIPVPCNVKNNCGIHATCEPTEDPSNYECQCNAGFNGDGYVCIEDQNCLNSPQLCDMNAKCLSTNSGLVCVCNQGFYGNGSLCHERQQFDSGFLLVSQGVVIVRVPLNGEKVRPISVASMAIGLDKDCIEGRVYWGDISTKKIVSAKYDGTDARPFITEDIEAPEGIAIDFISRRIYWTDSVKDTIEVASLEDSNLRAVIISKHLVNPRGIAIDPYREKLYWSDWNRDSPKIEMSDLDGTGRELLLGKDSVTLPNSLVVLESSGELCFADAGTKKVDCIDSYTKQTRTISNELTYPFGLTHTHNQFYWTDWTTKKLESVDSLGVRQNAIKTPFFGSHKMYGMTSIEEDCPQVKSPCQIKNGGCTDARLCLVNRKAPSGRSCKCTNLSNSCSIPQFGLQT